jgi:probable HAF family extracellular repeat protein
MAVRSAAVGALTLAALAPLSHAQPSFTPLGDLKGGAFSSKALAVSADGSVVVGMSTTAAGDSPFIWTSSQGMTPLPLLAGMTTGRVSSVSGDGSTIVGRCGDRAVRWSSGTPVDLNTFGSGAFSSANGISADGLVIVGNAFDGSFDTIPFRCLGGGCFPLAGNAPTFAPFEGYGALGASSDGSVIVGNFGLSFTQPFIWTSASGMAILPAAAGVPQPATGSANACSPDGSVIVGRSGPRACRWAEGFVDPLDDLPGASDGEALAVSALGTVIVGRATTSAGAEAFVWTPKSGTQSLAQFAADRGVTGLQSWTLSATTGVSADGRTFVGYGINPAGDTEAWIISIPDPALCYANCDGSTAPPVLNVADFACFFNAFAAGDSYANCDNSTIAPTLNVRDFSCFLNAFATGCP